MYPIQEIRRQQNVLDMAAKVLTLALLLQVPIIVIFASRMTRYFWTLPANVFWLLSGASSLLAIVGFTIVCRQLDLYAEALADSSLPDLAQKTRLLGSGKIVASVQFLFYVSFLLPLFNLPAILWARWKAKGGVHALEEALKAQKAQMARRPTPAVF